LAVANKKTPSQPDGAIQGGILRPNAGIQQEFVAAVLPLVQRMCREVQRDVVSVFESTALDGVAMDESAASQARMRLAKLLERWEGIFKRDGKDAAKRMVARTFKNSGVTTGMSLRDVVPGLTLNTDVLTGRLSEVVKASTTEAVSFITEIPRKYLAEVQAQVARSITTGNGLKDLVPFFEAKYDQNVRHARNVAMDMTRKTYTNINAARMKSAGVTQFKWLHTGGSQHPREDHIRLDGQVFDFDDPPVIGVMHGEKVRGLPAAMPFCRCVMRPILNFGARAETTAQENQ
jgi:SPP1 gp7 family putative phage head morphogenesis protein